MIGPGSPRWFTKCQMNLSATEDRPASIKLAQLGSAARTPVDIEQCVGPARMCPLFLLLWKKKSAQIRKGAVNRAQEKGPQAHATICVP